MEEYSFSVTEAEANVIIGALVKQPFEVVVHIIQKLQAQAEKQRKNRELMEVVSEKIPTT